MDNTIIFDGDDIHLQEISNCNKVLAPRKKVGYLT
jgi:hypothetical protein